MLRLSITVNGPVDPFLPIDHRVPWIDDTLEAQKLCHGAEMSEASGSPSLRHA